MKRLAQKNLIFSGITNVSDLLQFILMILAANLVSTHDFGIFRTAFSFSMVAMAFSDLGLNYLAIRDISRDHSVAPRYMGNILLWKIPLSIVLFGILMAVTFLAPRHDSLTHHMVALMGIAMALRFFSIAIRYFFQAFERFDLECVGAVVEQVLLVGGGCLLLLMGHGIVALAWLFLLTRIVGFLFTYGLMHRVTRPDFRLEFPFIWARQVEALPIGIAFGVLMAYVHIDTIIMSAVTSPDQVGIYNSAFSIYSGFFVIPAIVGNVSLPRLSDTFQNDRPVFRRIIAQGAGYIALLSVPVAVVGFFFSDIIIKLLYHDAYVGAIPALRILFVALVITSQNWLLRLVLIATNRQGMFMIIYLAGMFLRAIADVILIRQHGITGAAEAAFVSEGLLFAVMWIVILSRGWRARPS